MKSGHPVNRSFMKVVAAFHVKAAQDDRLTTIEVVSLCQCVLDIQDSQASLAVGSAERVTASDD